MTAMRRWRPEELFGHLIGVGCEEHNGFLEEGTNGKIFVTKSGKIFQTPPPDEEGFIPGYALDIMAKNMDEPLFPVPDNVVNIKN